MSSLQFIYVLNQHPENRLQKQKKISCSILYISNSQKKRH